MEFLLGISQVHMTSKMRLVKLLPSGVRRELSALC